MKRFFPTVSITFYANRRFEKSISISGLSNLTLCNPVDVKNLIDTLNKTKKNKMSTFLQNSFGFDRDAKSTLSHLSAWVLNFFFTSCGIHDIFYGGSVTICMVPNGGVRNRTLINQYLFVRSAGDVPIISETMRRRLRPSRSQLCGYKLSNNVLRL